MNSLRRAWFSFLADMAVRLGSAKADPGQLRRAAYRTDISSWPLRMTSFLRDRLRRGWLRIHRDH